MSPFCKFPEVNSPPRWWKDRGGSDDIAKDDDTKKAVGIELTLLTLSRILALLLSGGSISEDPMLCLFLLTSSDIHDGLARGKAVVAGLAAILVGWGPGLVTQSEDLASTPSTVSDRTSKWSEIRAAGHSNRPIYSSALVADYWQPFAGCSWQPVQRLIVPHLLGFGPGLRTVLVLLILLSLHLTLLLVK